MNKKAITVNGVMLDEYLKDKQSIQEEIDAKKFIDDGFEKVVIKRSFKQKYKQHTEENGKVKILGNLQINMANFENDLKRELSAKKTYNCIVIVLTAHSEQLLYETNEIANILKTFGKKHHIEVNKNVNWPIRSLLGTLKRSKLGQYLEFIDRKSHRQPTTFGYKKEFKENFTTKEAIKLSNEKLRERVKAIEAKNDVIVTEKKSDQASIVKKVVSELKHLSSTDGPLFTIHGDIHIHINISND